MNRNWGAGAATLAATAAGCTSVLGINKDYYPIGDGGAGGGGPSSSSISSSSVCTPSDKRCNGNLPESCDGAGQWQSEAACMGQTCNGGVCVGVCAPGDKRCMVGNFPQSCDGSGQWQAEATCMGQTCNGGVCVGVCAPGDKQCTGNVPQSCDGSGQWQSGAACSVQTEACVAGACATVQPSCAGLASTCGPSNNESCCASKPVTGGTYNRSNNPAYPATVSDFRLDRFEITVGRFRAFVAAYAGSKPAAGAGAHPLIAGSGWDPTWNGSLPADKAALMTAVKSCNFQTWTDAPGANENLPMNCIDWYDAFAFCAWDGGRLPTEAEWNYAAAGGSEQRQYPWGNPAADPQHAVYDCTGDGSASGDCAFTDILKVGSKAAGDGKWQQADLAGGVWEWNLDWHASPYPYPNNCNNCANLQSALHRGFRGGCWSYSSSGLLSFGRYVNVPAYRDDGLGARCARAS